MIIRLFVQLLIQRVSSTQATGLDSHAEGGLSISQSDYSHAECYNFHSEGYSTFANEMASHAGCSSSESNGDRPFVHGLGVKSQGHDHVVFGRYNTYYNSSILAIGNGTSYAGENNVLKLYSDGTLCIAGNLLWNAGSMSLNKTYYYQGIWKELVKIILIYQ